MMPGDFIEWVYENGNPVAYDVTIWSSILERWVPVGTRNNLVISIHDDIITWLNSAGLYSARIANDIKAIESDMSGIKMRVIRMRDTMRYGDEVLVRTC